MSETLFLKNLFHSFKTLKKKKHIYDFFYCQNHFFLSSQHRSGFLSPKTTFFILQNRSGILTNQNQFFFLPTKTYLNFFKQKKRLYS